MAHCSLSLLMNIKFFARREFSNEVSQKMSTKCNSSHFHHISITMLWGIRIVILLKKIDLETLQISSHSDKIVMKMWSPLQAFFCTYHIFITFLTQFDGKEFCQKYHDYATVHLSWKRDEYVISWDNRMLFENSRFLSFLHFYLTTPFEYFAFIYREILLRVLLKLKYFLSALLITIYKT